MRIREKKRERMEITRNIKKKKRSKQKKNNNEEKVFYL